MEMDGAPYDIVQPSSFHVWVAVTRSGHVRTQLTVRYVRIITRSRRKCVAGNNWTQDLNSGSMLDGTSSTNPTIKLRWYGRGEGASYDIVQ
jgi:hypothetical protein